MIRRCFIFAVLLGLSLAAASQATRPPAQTPNPTQDALVYRNAKFGFRYQIRYGWVDRTSEMREEAEKKPSSPDAPDSNASDTKSSDTKSSGGKSAKAKSDPANSNVISSKEKANSSEVLLAVFERPPDAPGDSINSAVVIASENAASYPGLKKAEDFLSPLTELTTTRGFKPDGDPSITSIDARELVRADFIKPLTEKIAMYQSTLILFAKGQIVTFTFIAGSEDEIDDLIDGLHFGPVKAGAR